MGKGKELTFEDVKPVAAKYKTRNEFKKGSESYYRKALKNDWLDKLGLPPHKWVFEAVQREVKEKKYQTRTELKNGTVGAYRSALNNKWLDTLFPQSK